MKFKNILTKDILYQKYIIVKVLIVIKKLGITQNMDYVEVVQK